MPNFFKMEVGDLIRFIRNRGAGFSEEVPTQAFSEEGHFRVANRGEVLEFFVPFRERALFAVAGALGGVLGTFPETGEGGLRQVRATVPVATESGDFAVRVSYQSPPGANPQDGVEGIRASNSLVPPDSRMLEFVFGREDQEFRYIFELPEKAVVTGFEEVVDHRPIFRTVPAVAQMAAFLRAMTHQRRTVLASLGDIVRAVGSEQAAQNYQVLAREYPPFHGFETSVVSRLHDLLKLEGREVRPAALSALCLFVDLSRGVLDEEAVMAAVREGRDPTISCMAAFVVSRFFCVEIPEREWDRVFEEPFSDCLVAFRRPPYPRIMAALRDSAQARSHLDILRDLGAESKSRRVASFVETALREVPSGCFEVNDEQVALRTLLSEQGRPVNTNTLTALCMFVDIEVGILTEEMLSTISEGGSGYDTSLYALLAAAGAFDVPLRAFTLSAIPEDAGRGFLQTCVTLTQGRVIAQFRAEGEEGFWLEYLPTAEDVGRALGGGLQFAGTVLVDLPVIDQLSELDVDTFLGSGKTVLACFAADNERAALWRKLTEADIPKEAAPSARKGLYTIIQGYTAYSFNRQIVGSLVSAVPEKLVGLTRVVTADRDQRGNNHYRLIERVGSRADLVPTEHGLTWSERVVELPDDVDELPDLLQELGQAPLLGRKEALLEEARTLELIQRSLDQLLTRRTEYLPLEGELRQTLLSRSRSSGVAAAVAGLVDLPTRDGLLDLLEKDERLEVEVYAPLAALCSGQEGEEYAVLEILLALCREESVRLERRLKQYDAKGFEAVLRHRRTQLLDSEAPAVRAGAARLLSTSNGIGDRHDRMVAEYELGRLREDSDPEVAQAAGSALSNLALSPVVPLPDAVRVSVPSAGEKKVSDQQGWLDVPGAEHLSRERVQAQAEELQRFLTLVKNRDTAVTRERDVSRRLEQLGQAAAGLSPSALMELAAVLVGLDVACSEAGIGGQHRYFALFPARTVQAVRGALVDSWRVFALSQEKRLAELMTDLDREELLSRYGDFVREKAIALSSELGQAPYLGGEPPLTIYHLKPGEAVGLSRRGPIASFSEKTLDFSPLALDLVAAGLSEERTYLCRLTCAGETPLEVLEEHLPTLTTERPVDPWTVTVYQPSRVRFTPFLHNLSLSREQFGGDEEVWEDFEALLSFFGGRRRSSEADDEGPSGGEAGEQGEGTAPAGPGLRDHAQALVRAFNLPEPYAKQVVNILLDVGPRSVYDL